jgi:NDP-sugar pyrophosphorylase family protein
MAAGEGTRLRPLTDVWPKPILPVDGRPVIATLLRELAAAGLTNVTLVTGHLADLVEALVGDGSGFGVELRIVRQPQADGSADAVRRALAGGARAPAIVVAADTVYRPGDIGLFAKEFEGSAAVGAIAVRSEPPAGPERPAVRVEPDGRVSSLLDVDRTNPFAGAALWGLGEALVWRLEGLQGPPYELYEPYQRAIDAGEHVIGVKVGPTRDLTRPADVVSRNFPYLWKQT